MPHRSLTTNRALRTTSAAAGALALLALPLAGPAMALSGLSETLLLPEEGEEVVDDLAARVLDIAARVGETTGADEVLPVPGDSQMAPAGSNYEPVAEPAPAPAPAPSPAQPAAASEAPPAAPAERPTVAHDANGPLLQGWVSRSTTAFEPVQAPVVAGPMTVPAPQFASSESLSALTGVVKDGWAAVASPAPVGADPHSPTQWPIAVAAGMLLLVGGAHALRVYDKQWKATQTTTE